MLAESNGQKNDIVKDKEGMLVPYEREFFSAGSYTKTNKLITALYMVTDIMDKDEPLRNKLRILGANILSDTFYLKGHSGSSDQISGKISELLSFLEVASGVGIISQMNSKIISKEFLELRKSIEEFTSPKGDNWLQEFIKEGGKEDDYYNDSTTKTILLKKSISNGHTGTRIGVQKGSTLMRALSDRIPELAKKKNDSSSVLLNKNNNHELKEKRRADIILAIKDIAKDNVNFVGATITDIKSIGHSSLISCGEKTLQRELVSMVSDGVLLKSGEKRWSKYRLKN